MSLGTVEERLERAAAVRARMFDPATPSQAPVGSAMPDDYREMMNEWVFGGVWSRPGLELEQRSLVTMATLTALGKLRYLKIHMGIARRLGITEEQIQEMLIQVAMYAGVPAANDGFKMADEAFAEIGRTTAVR